ncbi:MAG: hypothetical protein GY679_03375 [Mycoplasma sp.]|nr:hypothetical protein [Mycoplasma sp.]
MFFVNSDLKNSTNQKNLREVIDDENVKVAYGVLSLPNFYKMVKRVGDSEKIFIPKVQRGLVWKENDKEDFISNCIIGNNDIREPMPNIFLFCDKDTGEIQLFDGLQRTSAILKYFENINSIDDSKYNIMIPAALFKGSRSEAESLFRNINDRGVKLNEFEKLASYGGEYEIDYSKLSEIFQKNFNKFISEITAQYKDIGLETSSKEKTTIYEILTYAIYSFSKEKNARSIFPSKEENSFIKEWGYQIAYSTTTKEKKKIYKANMLKNLLYNFAEIIGYNKSKNSFNEELLNNYIEKIKKAINETEASIRDIYSRNVTTNNKEYLNKAALKSHALVGSLVIFNYLNPSKISKEFAMKWFLLQLISGRASSKTNQIIDELLKSSSSLTIEDIDYKIAQESISKIHKSIEEKNHSKWLWDLFYIHYDQIKDNALATQFEIDHIIPRSILKKQGISQEKQNDIGNLCLIKKLINRDKSSQMLHIFTNKKKEYLDEIANTITLNKKMSDYTALETISKDLEKHIIEGNNDSFKVAYDYFLTQRKNLLKKSIENKII